MKYAVGIDFGTLSARALIAEIGTGRELASVSMDYPHAVMDTCLPDGTKLESDWALQHPQDYIDCLKYIVPESVKRAGIDARDIVGVGIDFTACTILPADKDMTPLCMKPQFASRPHAYVKLWKHHAAQEEANRITALAEERGEAFLARYGGKISSEWMLSKVWQVLNEDEEIYRAADRFIEAGDWVLYQLIAKEMRSSSLAGYKGLWQKDLGYPSNEFLAALDPRLEHMIDEKIGHEVYPVCSRAGELTEEGAALLGLLPGTAVGVVQIDAHAALPACGIAEEGKMMMIMGTSGCHITLGKAQRIVPGMCGVVEGGAVPDLMCYEAGQCCLGDHYNWFVERCVPEDYEQEARSKGMDVHQLLTEKAAALRVGESGLLALDWWNGNRSVLVDADLTGMILGMTLSTRPEEIYRALIEATAYGTRIIIETFAKYGIETRTLYACGGIAQKNEFLMQTFCDVLGIDICIARSTQTSALGSAMLGAVAAGKTAGGYDSISDAAREMGGILEKIYHPNKAAHAAYNELYAEYVTLHDYFGRGGNSVMKTLKALREKAR